MRVTKVNVIAGLGALAAITTVRLDDGTEIENVKVLRENGGYKVSLPEGVASDEIDEQRIIAACRDASAAL